MPEGDDWEYSNGKNYVCACFVARFYKAGGLFDGYDILANEFTPKDVVQLDFFDKEYKEKKTKGMQRGGSGASILSDNGEMAGTDFWVLNYSSV